MPRSSSQNAFGYLDCGANQLSSHKLAFASVQACTHVGIPLAEGLDDRFGAVDGPAGAIKGGDVPSPAPANLAAAETGDFLVQEGVERIEVNRGWKARSLGLTLHGLNQQDGGQHAFWGYRTGEVLDKASYFPQDGLAISDPPKVVLPLKLDIVGTGYLTGQVATGSDTDIPGTFAVQD
jgi:hypothetical protein